MIKRVKLETIYKMAKEDNEKIKERKLFPDGWDEKVYDYYNKLSKESSDVEMFMEFLGGEDSPLEMAYAYRRNMYIMLYTMNATDTIAFVDGEYDIFYIVSKTATIITAGSGVSQTILTRSNTGVTTETNRSRNGS